MSHKNYVVRHSHEVVNYRLQNCQGGEGWIYVRQLLGFDINLPVPGFPDDSKSFHFVHLTTLPKGSSVGEHRHLNNEEIYLVIKGQGEMTVDGNVYLMGPGSIGLVKDGATHAMKNVGEEDLVMVVVEVKAYGDITSQEGEK